jgi:hypothetical protein
MITQYAVMIDTRAIGTDSAIGMFNGSLCWITGSSQDFDSGTLPENPVTQSAQTGWKRGILSESVMGTLAEAFDFLSGGGYSTRTGAEITVMNNVDGLGSTLFDYLVANEIDMLRMRARIYVVLDGVFHERGSFMIEEMENQEHALVFRLVDSFLTIHRDALKVEITQNSFSTAADGLTGRFLPVTIGMVPEAHGIRIASGPKFKTLSAPDIKVARVIDAGTNQITIKTEGQGIHFEPGELFGSLLRVIRKGSTNADPVVFTISGNGEGNGPNTVGITVLTVPGISGVNTTSPQNAWWVEIYRIDDYRVFSDAVIHSFKDPYVLGWQEKAFVSLWGKASKFLPSGAETLPAYASALARPDGKYALSTIEAGYEVNDGDILVSRNDDPVLSMPLSNTWLDITEDHNYPQSLGLVSEIQDGNKNSYRQRKIDWGLKIFHQSHQFVYSIRFKVPIPSGFHLETGDKLHCAVDGDFEATAIVPTDMNKRLRVGIQARLYDLYGHNSTAILIGPSSIKDDIQNAWSSVEFFRENSPESGAAMDTRTIELRQVDDSHYRGGVADGKVGFELGEEIQGLLLNPETARTIGGIEIQVYVLVTTPGGFTSGPEFRHTEITHRVREIVLYKRKETYEGEVYARVNGVKFGSGWGVDRSPPRNANDPILSPVDAIEYLIRKRDDKPEAVDTESFDVARGEAHPSWSLIGSQIIEQKNTKEYIEELARHAFMGITPARNGKRRIKLLHSYGEPVMIFGPDNVLDGSVESALVTDMDRIYTGVEIKYDWNPETDDYRKILFVRSTDKYIDDNSFPGSTEPDDDGILKWTKYVGGVSNYGLAKSLWSMFGRGYLKTRHSNVYRMESKWFQNNSRIGFQSLIGDSVFMLAHRIGTWLAYPRVRYTFTIPISADALKLQLLDTIWFRDTLRTGNLFFQCTTEELQLNPAENQITVTASRRIVDQGFTEEGDMVRNSIEELAEATDRILESNETGNRILEIVHE